MTLEEANAKAAGMAVNEEHWKEERRIRALQSVHGNKTRFTFCWSAIQGTSQ